MSYFCTLKESIVTNIVMRKTIFDLLDRKGSLPVSMLTAYDFNTARTIDEAGVDMILVGDSLGNVMLGYENTLAVTVEDMIHHGKAVCRGAKQAFVVVDMPFMSYQTSVEDAVRNAGRIMKETNCQAVKLGGWCGICRPHQGNRTSRNPCRSPYRTDPSVGQCHGRL